MNAVCGTVCGNENSKIISVDEELENSFKTDPEWTKTWFHVFRSKVGL
jgi:hypothetical protein